MFKLFRMRLGTHLMLIVVLACLCYGVILLWRSASYFAEGKRVEARIARYRIDRETYTRQAAMARANTKREEAKLTTYWWLTVQGKRWNDSPEAEDTLTAAQVVAVEKSRSQQEREEEKLEDCRVLIARVSEQLRRLKRAAVRPWLQVRFASD